MGAGFSEARLSPGSVAGCCCVNKAALSLIPVSSTGIGLYGSENFHCEKLDFLSVQFLWLLPP